jgi:hypothetical protein
MPDKIYKRTDSARTIEYQDELLFRAYPHLVDAPVFFDADRDMLTRQTKRSEKDTISCASLALFADTEADLIAFMKGDRPEGGGGQAARRNGCGHQAFRTQPGEGAMNAVAARTCFVAELQWPAARLPKAFNQFLQCRGGVGDCAIRRGLPDITRGGDRDDDRFLVHVHSDKSCRLFHDPSPVPEAPRQTIRRDP